MASVEETPAWVIEAFARIRKALRDRQIYHRATRESIVIPERENRQEFRKLVKEMGIKHAEVIAPRDIRMAMPPRKLHPYFIALTKLRHRIPLALPPKQDVLVIHWRSKENPHFEMKIVKRYHV